MGFPGNSAGKELVCNAGDPSSIPGLGRCPEEGIGHLLQYSWASLVAQLVKNLPALQKTWVRSLSQKDPLEEGMATHSSFLAWRNPHGQRCLASYSPWGRKESDMTEQLSMAQTLFGFNWVMWPLLGQWLGPGGDVFWMESLTAQPESPGMNPGEDELTKSKSCSLFPAPLQLYL